MSQKDWVEKDYYKVLGVSKDAKPDEIKKAFRKLARDNHPDQNQNDPKAEQRFKDISEANSVLSDPAKRKEYDEARSLFGGGHIDGVGQPQHLDARDGVLAVFFDANVGAPRGERERRQDAADDQQLDQRESALRRRGHGQ